MASQILADRDPIDVFKSWALQMGCPVDALPSQASLDRIKKLNLTSVQKFMDRFKPRSEVQLCRDNLLVSSLSDSSEVMVEQQTDQPNEWQNLKRKKKLKRQIDELKPRIEGLRSDVKDKNSFLTEKAQQIKEAKETHRSTESQFIQLEQTRAQLMEKIEMGKELERLLASVMPPPVVDLATDSKNKAERWVKKSVQYIRTVYNDAGDRELTKTDSDNVQRVIQEDVAGIPVVMLYDAIKRYCEKNVAQINSIGQPPSEAAAPAQSAFDIAITKSRIRMYVDHHLARKKLQNDYTARVEQYVQLYEEFLEQMINQAKSGDESDMELFADSICADYLKQYGTSIGNQAILQWKKRKLSALQQRFTERQEQLYGHDVVATELTDMYKLISKTYNSAYHEVLLLGDTNQSLKALQALSIYTINNFGQRQQSVFNGTLGPVTSSMKLKPTDYKSALSVLVNVKHEQWKRLPASMDIQCLRPNDAISPFYTLLTPNGTLEQLKKRWAWYKVIQVLTQPLDVNESVFQVNDVELLSAKANAESIKMTKIMDEIRFMYQTGNYTAAEIQKYLQFLLDTSLGSLIPDTVMVNRRNFRDYEEEFLCACSLIAKSMKKD